MTTKPDREAEIDRIVRKTGAARRFVELAYDDQEAYIEDWGRQLREYADRYPEQFHEEPDTPPWLTEQQKLHERLKKERERDRLDRVARGRRNVRSKR